MASKDWLGYRLLAACVIKSRRKELHILNEATQQQVITSGHFDMSPASSSLKSFVFLLPYPLWVAFRARGADSPHTHTHTGVTM